MECRYGVRLVLLGCSSEDCCSVVNSDGLETKEDAGRRYVIKATKRTVSVVDENPVYSFAPKAADTFEVFHSCWDCLRHTNLCFTLLTRTTLKVKIFSMDDSIG